jgi:hypothetical protein
MVKKIVIGVIALLVTSGFSQEDYAQWSYYKKITINTKASGANVLNAVTQIPVLVRLGATNTDVFSGAKAQGADIRFAKKNGTHLQYQIERWDAVNKLAELWVLLDTVQGTDSVQYIKMLWGKSSAADSSKPSAVFDTSNGFQAVWHMSDTSGSILHDATVNNYNGTPFGKANGTKKPADTLGAIGIAKQFFNLASDTSYYLIPNTKNSKLDFYDSTTNKYTLSAWVNPDTLIGGSKNIVSKGIYQYCLYFNHGASSLTLSENFGSTRKCDTAAGFVRQWKHVVGVCNGTNLSLYVNGALTGSSYTTSMSTKRSDTCNVYIGRRADNGGWEPFIGCIDEVEMSNAVRSEDWIQLSYQTQKPGQTALTFGTTSGNNGSAVREEGSPTHASASFFVKAAYSAPMVFTLPSKGASQITVSIVDVMGHLVWKKSADMNGLNGLVWNGRTAGGSKAPDGAYVVCVTMLDTHLQVTPVQKKMLTFFQ